MKHPAAAKIAFTGSTGVGKWIQRELAGTGKRLTLELGGKGANIVFEDAAIDQAVEGIVNGIFFNQGHVCCAGSRLLVQESIEGEVMRKLKLRMKSLRVGDPLDKNTDIGAINSKAPARAHHRAGGRRCRGRGGNFPTGLQATGKGILLRADPAWRGDAEPPGGEGGDLRAGAFGADFPDAGGGGGESEQHGLRL